MNMGLCRHLGIVSRNSSKRSLGNLFLRRMNLIAQIAFIALCSTGTIFLLDATGSFFSSIFYRFDHYLGLPFSNSEQCADEDNPLRCFLYENNTLIEQVGLYRQMNIFR